MCPRGDAWQFFHQQKISGSKFFLFSQIKQAEKQAMIEGIRENGSEAAEFVIKKVRSNR